MELVKQTLGNTLQSTLPHASLVKPQIKTNRLAPARAKIADTIRRVLIVGSHYTLKTSTSPL